MIALALATALGASVQPRAQDLSSYSHGYTDGYAGRIPQGGAPGPETEYGRGFQAGQDDADHDDETDRRSIDSFERSLHQQQGASPATGNDDK